VVGQAILSPVLHRNWFSQIGADHVFAWSAFFISHLYALLQLPPGRTKLVKFFSGIVLGALLSAGVMTVSAQPERLRHPRIAKAIDALEDARAYMREAAHDFGGHRVEAIRATDEAIKQLRLALAYRAEEDREHRR
jgi:hypothetical protein